MRKFFTPTPNPRSLLAMLPLLAFDLDGTLVDSAPDIVSAVNIVLTRHHKPALPYETIVAHIGDGLRQLITDAFAPYHPSERSQRDIELEFYSTYEQEMLKLTKPFPGVMEFLASYQGPIGVITNKSERPARIILDHLGFDAFPWVQIYGGDTWEEKKAQRPPFRKNDGSCPAHSSKHFNDWGRHSRYGDRTKLRGYRSGDHLWLFDLGDSRKVPAALFSPSLSRTTQNH